jgi:hypothetical protein
MPGTKKPAGVEGGLIVVAGGCFLFQARILESEAVAT